MNPGYVTNHHIPSIDSLLESNALALQGIATLPKFQRPLSYQARCPRMVGNTVRPVNSGHGPTATLSLIRSNVVWVTVMVGKVFQSRMIAWWKH